MRIVSRRVFLVVMAVCVMSVVGTASASAAKPELTVEGGGKAAGVKFTSTFKVGSPFWDSRQVGHKVNCQTGAATGEVTGPKEGTETAAFTGCEEPALGHKCETGSVLGEIVDPFTTQLVYLSKAKKELALLVSLPKAMKYDCGTTQNVTMSGGFLMKVPGELYAPAKTFTFAVKQSQGEPGLSEYESEAGKKVKVALDWSENEGKPYESALDFEEAMTFEHSVEFGG
jgi:hypothetical protein